MIKRLSAIILLLILSGCSSVSTPDNSDVPIISNDIGVRAAEIKLAEAADSVSLSLSQLAQIERASNPPMRLPSPSDPKMIDMGQLATVEWTGPIGPLVEKIAQASHYRLRKLGNPPAIPVLVSISTKDTPLADILRNANFQCGNKANIVIYPASRTIELRYAKS
jgi:defect-in-organelle-trafficking protein DotD